MNSSLIHLALLALGLLLSEQLYSQPLHPIGNFNRGVEALQEVLDSGHLSRCKQNSHIKGRIARLLTNDCSDFLNFHDEQLKLADQLLKDNFDHLLHEDKQMSVHLREKMFSYTLKIRSLEYYHEKKMENAFFYDTRDLVLKIEPKLESLVEELYQTLSSN